MTHTLKKLVIQRVDLVGKGSNPLSDIVLFKAHADGDPPSPIQKVTFDEVQDSRALAAAMNQVCQYTWDLQRAIESSLWSDGNQASEVRASVQQFSNAVDDALASWVAGKPVGKEFEATVKQFTEHTAPAVLSLIKEHTMSGTAVADKPSEPVVTEDVKKTLPVEVQKALDDSARQVAEATAIAKAAQASAEAAQEEARVEKARRETSEMVAFVKAELSKLPGDGTKTADLLYVIKSKVTPEQYTELITLLKAGHAAQKLVDVEKGISDDDSKDTSDARGQLEEKAKEIQKAHPGMTLIKARDKAYQEHPELVRAVRGR